MNAVFTVVAKNYYALAKTLGDSIKKTNPEVDFFIFLSDEADGYIEIENEFHKTIEVRQLNIPNWKEMAFKYDVVEFSTAVKPFIFDILFNEKNYDKVLYIDPDIYVFNSLNEIFEILKDRFVVITPHVNNMEIDWNGALQEESILVSGVYNLGFIGISNSSEGKKIVKWWMTRLKDLCYTDKMDGLFYDQKWIDMIPAFFDKGVCILRKYGYNVAWWNMHERKLLESKAEYLIEGKDESFLSEPLVFFHFSGYDVLNPRYINRRFMKNPKFVLDSNKELEKIYIDYSQKVVSNGHEKLCKAPYKYNFYENGVSINKFARRTFRKFVEIPKRYSYEDPFRRKMHKTINEKQYFFENPFSISQDSFYEMLRKNKLIVENNTLDKINLDNENLGLEKKIKLLIVFLRIGKRILGIKNYLMLIKFFERYSKEEYQLFLFDDIYKNLE